MRSTFELALGSNNLLDISGFCPHRPSFHYCQVPLCLPSSSPFLSNMNDLLLVLPVHYETNHWYRDPTVQASVHQSLESLCVWNWLDEHFGNNRNNRPVVVFSCIENPRILDFIFFCSLLLVFLTAGKRYHTETVMIPKCWGSFSNSFVTAKMIN